MKLVTVNERAWLDASANGSSTPVVQGTIVVANQAADVVALVDNSGGAAADGTIGVVTIPTLGWNGSTDPTAAEATAVNAAITALRDAIKELSTKQAAVLTALKAANIML